MDDTGRAHRSLSLRSPRSECWNATGVTSRPCAGVARDDSDGPFATGAPIPCVGRERPHLPIDSGAASCCSPGRRRPRHGPALRWCGSTSRRCSRRAAWSPGCTTRGSRRREVVVELAVDPARFRTPESIGGEPWTHTPLTEPWFDRLHFLVWANNYDLRSGEPVWWWSTKTCRLAEGVVVIAPTHDAPGDVRLADGRAVWVDGGPRRPAAAGELVVHAESVELGVCTLVPQRARRPTTSPPTNWPQSPTTAGPARIVAPAGSGKTRVLTARLRHLVGDRGVESGAVLAVAYNKQAQLEMEQRTRDVAEAAGGVHIRTLNALGLWVLARHRGRSPALLEERDARRLVESLLPGRRARRANVDPIGPYLEGLASVRLGLRDPDEVEASRDDVPGLVELFPAYRAALRRARRGRLRRAGVRRRRGAAHRRGVPTRRAALVPAPARRRVPGPHAGARAAVAAARAARARRLRRRRRRPVHLRPRRCRPGVPHRLRHAVPRRRPTRPARQPPLPGRRRRRRIDAPRLQRAPHPQVDRGRPDQRRRRRRAGGPRARAGRQRACAGRDGAGLARRPDGGTVVDRRARSRQLTAARPARRPARRRRADRLGADARRAHPHRPARRARLPAHRHQPGWVRPS